MSLLNYQVIIPARKGSKRFPGKNKTHLAGKPLFQHSIEFALKEGIPANQIWINSDDEELLELAKGFHVNTYRREEALAGDLTSTAAVLRDQVVFFQNKNIACDAVILLQVTNPLRPAELLSKSLEIFNSSDRSSLCTFSRLNKKFGSIDKDYFFPKNYLPGQRMQDLEPLFFENGLLYITKVDLLLQAEKIIGDDVFPMVMDHIYAQVDIDEPDDLILAEYLIENYINETF